MERGLKNYYIGVIFFCILVIVVTFISHVKEVSNKEVLEARMEVCQQTVSSLSSFYRAMSSVGKIPYDSEYSTCYDHSKLLAYKLAVENIKSSIMINEDRSHAWVAVWVEATTGQFIPIDNQDRILEIRDGLKSEVIQFYK